MNLSIIIPNYNGGKLLQENLPKVLAAVKDYKKGKIEIIIPNDPSTDNSSEVIKKFINSITEKHITSKTIENNNKNEAGFSKNVTRGVKASTGDILILLNSDVAPHKNFLEPLVAHFKDEQIFAVGCMDESIESDKVVLRGRGIGRWQRGFLMHSAGKLDKETTLWASGGSSAFRKNIWDKLQGLDVLYNPFYWEDIDLSYRALKSGYKIIFEKKSIIRHEHEKGAIRNKFTPSQVKKIVYRNQFIFVWKNITQTDLLISHIIWLPYYFLKTLLSGDFAFWSGFYQAVLRLPQIMQSRRRVTKFFVKSDTDILKNYTA